MHIRYLLVCIVVATLCLAFGTQAAAESKIYWTDSNLDTIQRANLDGSGVEVLLNDLDGPVPIAIDVEGQKTPSAS